MAAAIALPPRMMEKPRLDVLTARQREVVHAALRGLTRPAIAAELDISLDTVRNHLTKAYERLGIHSRAALLDIFLADATISARDEGYASGYRHGYVDGLDKGRKEAAYRRQEGQHA
jgi:DNA-binding CsgD family transcriptional regulator